MTSTLTFDVNAIDFEKGGGTVVVVTQDAVTGAVLMTAFADREAIERTIATRQMHYRSRTRGLWRKGETSGNGQRVVSLTADCDGDAVLARVVQTGVACHTGTPSCFGECALEATAFDALDAVIASRAAQSGDPQSYTRRLLSDRNLRLKKIGEEAAELVTALADGARDDIANEAADLLYHVLVAARAAGVSLNDIRSILADRAR